MNPLRADWWTKRVFERHWSRPVRRLSHKPVATVGALRTGTNYLRFLLERNYMCDVVQDQYGWKHAPISVDARLWGVHVMSVPVVAICKDPYAFVLSLYRYRCEVDLNIDASRDWDAFLRERLIIFNHSPEGSPHLWFANPVQYWNALYWNLSHLPGQGQIAFVLRYESVVAEPEKVLTPVADRLGLRRRKGPWTVPEGRMRRLSASQAISEGTTPTGGAAVAPCAEAPVLKYTDAQIEFVRTELNAELVTMLGYSSVPAQAACA